MAQIFYFVMEKPRIQLMKYLTIDEYKACENALMDDVDLTFELFSKVLNYYIKERMIPSDILNGKKGDLKTYIMDRLFEALCDVSDSTEENQSSNMADI